MATPSKFTASEFVCLASMPQKAANFACAPMASVGVALSHQAMRWRIESDARRSVASRATSIAIVVSLPSASRGSEDVNRWMVANGWAVAYRRYRADYVADEDAARRKRINMWSGDFEMPWDWRAQRRNY